MAVPKLADPILNDLVLILNGRKNGDLSSPAVSRYTLHISRIDKELLEARDRSGNRAIAVGEEVVTISRAELNRLTGAVQTSADVQLQQVQEIADLRLKGAAYEALVDTLFAEFAEDLAAIEGAGPADVILALLRTWRPHAHSPETTAGDPVRAPEPPADPRPADRRAGARRSQ